MAFEILPFAESFFDGPFLPESWRLPVKHHDLEQCQTYTIHMGVSESDTESFSNGEPKMAPGIEDHTARTFELKEHCENHRVL